ncbi:5-amino-6-(5-phosphoribosylamino)uracil reductase [Actinoalloteichus hoggarensis]|uniref:2,5-diamino-6-ribosylamino-4(3H)-pyrimidinone 5'-phosphate reductase n=1 Tax=Actinoalloteichus hoggarensis TaxID=1470176 RepID=A0A221W8R8_9PSEU|nr:dihydrofolate reductase family protein [Actinoalloteichus hoggarensis]ASO21919.1 2,5-diamino-6-ribosylamino-4(3H)-pyrimidinone 5'-phosphate reductase [Actinoalloteichus hoggarensis]MBB5924531.1 5-amino-6-(5-phosphoribosylamino)uracil reductase [Actinoalloteichus hoggarensis]
MQSLFLASTETGATVAADAAERPVPGLLLSEPEIENVYAYPEPLDRPWLRVNFVTSLDGAASAVDGRSRSLSSPADRRMLSMLRDLSDVILVGAGTAVAEGYRAVRPRESRAERRARLRLAVLPSIAVVTGTADLDPASGLFADASADAPTIVFTVESAPTDRRRALADAGADVVIVGDGAVEPSALIAELDHRGLRRVCCEGGPRLFGSLIAADVVDELCLTVAPLLEGGAAPRLAAAAPPVAAPVGMTLRSVLLADGQLFLRHARASARPGSSVQRA